MHVADDGQVKHRRLGCDEAIRWQKALQLFEHQVVRNRLARQRIWTCNGETSLRRLFKPPVHCARLDRTACSRLIFELQRGFVRTQSLHAFEVEHDRADRQNDRAWRYVQRFQIDHRDRIG